MVTKFQLNGTWMKEINHKETWTGPFQRQPSGGLLVAQTFLKPNLPTREAKIMVFFVVILMIDGFQ